MRLPASAVLAASALLTTGCATSRYTQSRIAAVPEGVDGRAGSSSTLRVRGVALRIESLDRAPANETVPALRLGLSFDVREIGYSFDASQVHVRGRGGERWPARRLAEPRYEPIASGSRFTLAFDVAVAGDSQLELVVAGLARGREKLEPVVLPLERRGGRSYDRLYWLEAIGAVLLAPLAIAGAAP